MKTGRTFSLWRWLRRFFSVTPSSLARRASEKPLRLSLRIRSASMPDRPRVLTFSSSLMRSSICTRNHSSMRVSSKTSSMLLPARKASATYQIRSAPGTVSSRLRMPSASGSFRSSLGSKPATPTSSPRRAFCTDSWKVRPMAITSPTDFIWVVRRASAFGNFSKAKRGTLVTT
ncbi:hypothetical protein D9M68_827770 [compost metagenome]